MSQPVGPPEPWAPTPVFGRVTAATSEVRVEVGCGVSGVSVGCGASGGSVGAAAVVTVTGAVSPVGATVKVPASAVALLNYSPGADDTVTAKCREMLPEPGALKGPLQVSVSPAIAGSLVVTPVVDPAV